MARHGVVLVIDEHEDSRIILRTVLEHSGFDVVEAANPRVGVQLARQCPPGLIIVELVMRQLSGFEALLLLRLDGVLAGCPVIATGAPELERVAESAGFQAFVPKPFDIAQLLNVLRTLTPPLDA